MIAIPDPIKRKRVKSTLIIVILVTIPCYLIGLILVWVGNAVKNRSTATPVIEVSETVAVDIASPTLPRPTAIFETPTPTLTPTQGPTPTPSATYFIPSSTPSLTPTQTSSPTSTATPTQTPSPTNSPEPTTAEATSGG